MPQPQNAKRIRPSMPDYGITSDETDGMLTWDWVDTQMEKSRNYWICTTRADGRPHAVPVWGVWVDNTFVFSTGRTAVKAKNIARDNHVVVHLESGDDTLIIEGVLIELQRTHALKQTVNRAYVKKYPSYDPAGEDESSGGIWYQLVPHKIMTWLESDFLNSVTYWVFDTD